MGHRTQEACLREVNGTFQWRRSSTCEYCSNYVINSLELADRLEIESKAAFSNLESISIFPPACSLIPLLGLTPRQAKRRPWSRLAGGDGPCAADGNGAAALFEQPVGFGRPPVSGDFVLRHPLWWSTFRAPPGCLAQAARVPLAAE
uniref:Uncharacterized protein n=1 Tax=Trichuris muris TaxID=70415 RepID=A0A5S6Q8V0_TRIMR